MKKIIILSLMFGISIYATDFNKGAAVQLYGKDAWKGYKCNTCHGNKGELDPLNEGNKPINKYSKKELYSKLTKLKFMINYNYNKPVVRVKEHTPIAHINDVQKESIAKYIGKGISTSSTEAKKTVEVDFNRGINGLF